METFASVGAGRKEPNNSRVWIIDYSRGPVGDPLHAIDDRVASDLSDKRTGSVLQEPPQNA